MAESKLARNNRLKAMRRKYGLGEFKKNSSSKTKVVYMAKRRKTARRSSGFKKKRTSHRSTGGSMMSGWLPLSGKEMMIDFGVGAVSAPINSFLKPYQEQYLGFFGTYSDEAAMAIVGSVAHKFGSGIIKDTGKELFRMSVISAGQQTGQGLFNATSGSSAPSGTQYM